MLKVSNSLHPSNQRDLRFGQASGGWRLRWNSGLCSGRVEFRHPMIHSDRRRIQHALGSAHRLAEETHIWKKISLSILTCNEQDKIDFYSMQSFNEILSIFIFQNLQIDLIAL